MVAQSIHGEGASIKVMAAYQSGTHIHFFRVEDHPVAHCSCAIPLRGDTAQFVVKDVWTSSINHERLAIGIRHANVIGGVVPGAHVVMPRQQCGILHADERTHTQWIYPGHTACVSPCNSLVYTTTMPSHIRVFRVGVCVAQWMAGLTPLHTVAGATKVFVLVHGGVRVLDAETGVCVFRVSLPMAHTISLQNDITDVSTRGSAESVFVAIAPERVVLFDTRVQSRQHTVHFVGSKWLPDADFSDRELVLLSDNLHIVDTRMLKLSHSVGVYGSLYSSAWSRPERMVVSHFSGHVCTLHVDTNTVNNWRV